mgnify:CR=1 FL=1
MRQTNKIGLVVLDSQFDHALREETVTKLRVYNSKGTVIVAPNSCGSDVERDGTLSIPSLWAKTGRISTLCIQRRRSVQSVRT